MAPQLSPEIWHLVFFQLSLEAALIQRTEIETEDLRRARSEFPGYRPHFGYNPPATALLDLCRVSRGFAALAQPQLFRWYDAGFWRRLSKNGHLLFLDGAVLANPRLALWVQEAHLDDDGWFPRESPEVKKYVDVL